MQSKCIWFLPFLLLIFCLSCKNPADPYIKIDFSLTSPKTKWQYYSDDRILFSLNINTDAVIWNSSIDGFLGKGNHLFSFLSPGNHTISAEYMNIHKTMHVSVVQRIMQPGAEVKTLVNYSPLKKLIPPHRYFPYINTLGGSVGGFKMDGGKSESFDHAVRRSRSISEDIDEPLRDIHMPLSMPEGKSMIQSAISTRNRRSAAEPEKYFPGQTRSFFVVNTASQYADPHEIQAELYYISNSLTVWTAVDSVINEMELRKCIEAAESVIIHRIKLLFGSPADIDGDGRCAILVTPTINDEKVAVGFFNPADFFKRNNDVSSLNYNPASNEMDVIYIAVPESGRNSSYRSETIIATIAHEFTHAVTFSVKTWQSIAEGDTTASREELFLDEGWSHLAENLCGYGVSGGNINFLQRYFEDTAAYSLCGPNRLGQDDSAGMRGGITLFLSWLFWNKGGIIWDRDDPLLFTDNGGITFLRNMIQSSITGWECIGMSYGTSADVLFEQMISEINMQRIENTVFECIIDPLTEEPVDFFSNMTFPFGGNSVHIGFPLVCDPYEHKQDRIVPWSFQLFDPVTFSDASEITIFAEQYNGTVYYNLTYDHVTR